MGKSTLASAIAAERRAVLWDLGEANVGDNFFSGQILRSFSGDNGYGYLQALGRGEALVVMDAFDEAWVKAGDDNVQGFLDTLAAQLKEMNPSQPPVVLLARTEAADFAEMVMNEAGLSTAHYTIAYFERPQAEEFIDLKLDEDDKSQHRSHRDAFVEVRDLLFERVFQVLGLSDWDDLEAKSFLGYAPVLDALSEFLNTNYASVRADLVSSNDEMAGESIWRFLVDIIERILERERAKLNLPDTLVERISPQTLKTLFGHEEQCARLAALVLETSAPEFEIPAEIKKEYEEAVQLMLPDHPFLATSSRFASDVFGDYVWARALQSPLLNESVRVRLAHSIGTPLLARFMIEAAPQEGDSPIIPLRDFPVFYESVRTDAAAGQASLSIRQVEGALQADLSRGDGDLLLNLSGTADDGVEFIRRLADADIAADTLSVKLGQPTEDFYVGPNVTIRASTVTVASPTLRVEPGDGPAEEVVILAGAFNASLPNPKVHLTGSAALEILTPESLPHPWAIYRSAPPDPAPDEDDLRAALTELSHLVGRFKSQGYGRLATHAKPLESATAKGRLSQRMLDYARERKLIANSSDGKMLELDHDAVSLNFAHVKAGLLDDPVTIEFLRSYLQS